MKSTNKWRYSGLIIFVFLYTTCAAPAPEAATANNGTAPKSLFIQLSTLTTTPPPTIREWFSHIAAQHRDSAKDDYIANLVLQDIADESGNMYIGLLDIIDDFFADFDNIFVGTVDLTWTGTGSKYLEGICDSDFRLENIHKSHTAAAAFRGKYPDLVFNWYITYEANLSIFDDPSCKNAYEAYLIELVSQLHSVYPNRSTLWSPTFWTKYNQTIPAMRASLKTNLSDLFANIKSQSNGIGINWLDIQDRIGSTYCESSSEKFTTDDIKNYYTFLKTLSYTFSSLRVNMETFRMDCANSDNCINGDPIEIQSRENFYERNNIPLGACWEIRFWRHTHKEIE